uniref:Uncharacterized protein n=1 Tax=Glossina morsitans morsitans TaxID=37546 RepID=A0A1B0G0W0_GLOMM
MQALDILEKRIDTLSRILGPVPTASATCTTDASESNSTVTVTENIVDSLISANNIMNEAISGREQIKGLMNRTDELEKYLDPNFLEESQQVCAKEVYLNAISHDLHLQFAELEQIRDLEPTLGAEYFRNIPAEGMDDLLHINMENEEIARQSEMIEESLILAMKHYGEIQEKVMSSLETMNKRLHKLEEKMLQKQREEMNKSIE